MIDYIPKKIDGYVNGLFSLKKCDACRRTKKGRPRGGSMTNNYYNVAPPCPGGAPCGGEPSLLKIECCLR